MPPFTRLAWLWSQMISLSSDGVTFRNVKHNSGGEILSGPVASHPSLASAGTSPPRPHRQIHQRPPGNRPISSPTPPDPLRLRLELLVFKLELNEFKSLFPFRSREIRENREFSGKIRKN